MVRAGVAGLGQNRASGATGKYLDNVRINPLIFFDNIVGRIDATNIALLILSVSVMVVKLCTGWSPH